jgi:hypothetical protein
MEQTAKEFLDYLCYIGLVTDDSINIFLTTLNSCVNSSEKIKEILINTLFSFFQNLPEINQKSMSLKLVNKFFEHKLKANTNILKTIIDIYERFQTRKKKHYYNLWYLLTFNYDMNKMINFHKKKEDIEIKIENNNLDNNLFTFQNTRNYKGSSYQNLRKNFYKKNSNEILNKRSKSNNTSRTILQDFISRQDEYNKHKKRNKEKLMKRSEDEFGKNCTFAPHISKKSFDKNYNNISTNQNNYSSDPNNNIYQKLYEDSNRRQIIRNQKIVDYVKRIKSESNFHSQSGNSQNSRKFIDRNKIEKLYNDYKQKQNKRRELTDKIDKEEGITFRPYISKKNKK